MSQHSPFRVQLLLAGALLAVLSGCSSPSATKAGGAAEVSVSASGQAMGGNLEDKLSKGMTREQVRAAIGAPQEARPEDVPIEAAEIWLYRRTKDVVRQKVVGTQDTPVVDPFTGQTRMVPAPVYGMETTTIIQELNLFWEKDALVRWKSETSQARSYFR